jgi:hypothetical protein
MHHFYFKPQCSVPVTGVRRNSENNSVQFVIEGSEGNNKSVRTFSHLYLLPLQPFKYRQQFLLRTTMTLLLLLLLPSARGARGLTLMTLTDKETEIFFDQSRLIKKRLKMRRVTSRTLASWRIRSVNQSSLRTNSR